MKIGDKVSYFITKKLKLVDEIFQTRLIHLEKYFNYEIKVYESDIQ